MRLFRDRRGVSAAEFALWAPAFLLLLCGAFDLGNQAQLSIRLQHAARAGAQVAFADSSDAAVIRAAVMQSFPGLTAAEVTVTCLCDAAEQACNAGCAAPAVRRVRISAQRTVTPLLISGANRGEGHATVRPG